MLQRYYKRVDATRLDGNASKDTYVHLNIVARWLRI